MSMKKLALLLAMHHWPVFPCHPETKQPLTRHGFKDATMDVVKVQKWWERNPDAMIGIPTGTINGIVVLDINPPEGKSLNWALTTLRNAGINIGTKTVQTPNGLHLYYRIPEGRDYRNRGKLLDGAIDCVRGTGGYVIAPGSVKRDGARYDNLNEVTEALPVNDALDVLIS
jgi:putative DNA primase/helicase